jgi:hypothetical protein
MNSFRKDDVVVVVSAGKNEQCIYPDHRLGIIYSDPKDGDNFCDVLLIGFCRVFYFPSQLEKVDGVEYVAGAIVAKEDVRRP